MNRYIQVLSDNISVLADKPILEFWGLDNPVWENDFIEIESESLGKKLYWDHSHIMADGEDIYLFAINPNNEICDFIRFERSR